MGDFDLVLTARLDGLRELGMLLTRLKAPLRGDSLAMGGVLDSRLEEEDESEGEMEGRGTEVEDMLAGLRVEARSDGSQFKEYSSEWGEEVRSDSVDHDLQLIN